MATVLEGYVMENVYLGIVTITIGIGHVVDRYYNRQGSEVLRGLVNIYVYGFRPQYLQRYKQWKD